MLEKFLSKLAGKFMAKKLDLQEDGKMDKTKPWYKSTAIWAGVTAVLLSAYGTAAIQFSLPPVPEWIYGLLAGFGVYGRATAEKKITN